MSRTMDGVITEADFRSYIAAFNRSDFDAFGRFYAPHVEFFWPGRAAQGRENVVRFYRDVKSRVRETLTLHGLVVGSHAVVADLETELHALIDWPDLPTGPLLRGETRRSQNFIWYDVAERSILADPFRAPSPPRVPMMSSTDMTATPDDTPMSAERFREYIHAFNRGEYAAFGRLLRRAGRARYRGQTRAPRTRDAIFDFYRAVKSSDAADDRSAERDQRRKSDRRRAAIGSFSRWKICRTSLRAP